MHIDIVPLKRQVMKQYPDDWFEFFYYDITSPSGLRWSKDITAGRGQYIQYIKSSPVGSITKDNRWSVSIKINNKQCRFYCHRIIWEIHFGKIPEGMIIDHLDGNAQNNDISNLKLTNYAGNNRNRGIDSRNTSGLAGVTTITVGIYQYACAYWCDQDGNKIQKKFSVLKHGLEKATRLAIDARLFAINELIALGCEYTERHGK